MSKPGAAEFLSYVSDPIFPCVGAKSAVAVFALSHAPQLNAHFPVRHFSYVSILYCFDKRFRSRSLAALLLWWHFAGETAVFEYRPRIEAVESPYY